MKIIFNREPFTPWKIIILGRGLDKEDEEIEAEDPCHHEDMEFEFFYRTTRRDGRECEQFTIMLNEAEFVCFQMQIFKMEM